MGRTVAVALRRQAAVGHTVRLGDGAQPRRQRPPKVAGLATGLAAPCVPVETVGPVAVTPCPPRQRPFHLRVPGLPDAEGAPVPGHDAVLAVGGPAPRPVGGEANTPGHPDPLPVGVPPGVAPDGLLAPREVAQPADAVALLRRAVQGGRRPRRGRVGVALEIVVGPRPPVHGTGLGLPRALAETFPFAVVEGLLLATRGLLAVRGATGAGADATDPGLATGRQDLARGRHVDARLVVPVGAVGALVPGRRLVPSDTAGGVGRKGVPSRLATRRDVVAAAVAGLGRHVRRRPVAGVAASCPFADPASVGAPDAFPALGGRHSFCALFRETVLAVSRKKRRVEDFSFGCKKKNAAKGGSAVCSVRISSKYRSYRRVVSWQTAHQTTIWSSLPIPGHYSATINRVSRCLGIS